MPDPDPATPPPAAAAQAGAGLPIPPPPPEATIWEGHPSQAINFGVFLVCGLLFILVVPLFVALWKYLEVRARTYVLTNQRIKISRGVFSKQVEDLELYRVKDMVLRIPFHLRFVNAGDIVLTTPDHSEPEVILPAIPDATKVKDLIREHVQRERDRKRVLEVETG